MYVDVESREFDWIAGYKLCTGFVNPRPIALVSTIDPEGRTNLAPFSFYNLVAARPPVVVLGPSLRRDGRPKDTLVNIEATGEFVIATVTEDIGPQMVRCAADLPHGQSEFDFSGLTPQDATKVRPPLVRQARANLECRLRQIIRTGGEPGCGAIVLGDVVAIHVDDAVLDENGQVDPHKLRTLGRLGGQSYCAVTQPFELEIPKP